jgi:hypothetical protein
MRVPIDRGSQLECNPRWIKRWLYVFLARFNERGMCSNMVISGKTNLRIVNNRCPSFNLEKKLSILPATQLPPSIGGRYGLEHDSTDISGGYTDYSPTPIPSQRL